MDIEELKQRLQGVEWNDFEVKEAKRDVPHGAYKSVSAFSNTAGGWLVFGIKQDGEIFEIIGVVEVDKVHRAFLSALRDGQKLSRKIFPRESLIEADGKRVLAFYIPESPRSDKPVYLGNNISNAFVRRGGANYRCSDGELRRFLRDADGERDEDKLVDEDVSRCFDVRSLSWFRAEYTRRGSGKFAELSDSDFLEQWGLLSEQGGSLYPTRAAILLFGTQRAVIRLLPRPVIDFQVIPAGFETGSGDERWADRVVVEDNLVNAWRTLLDRFLARAESGFSVDPATLQRQDQPPDYIAFREATINLLVHQDYGEHFGKASLRMFRDRTVFSNPGDSFSPTASLLDAADRDVRNPRIVAAFRRVGLAEQGGTGIGAIFRSWRTLGRVPPVISNDKASKRFELALLREPLVGARQVLLKAELGVRLSEDEAAVFAIACRQPTLTLFDIRAATGLREAAAGKLARRLETQALLEAIGAGGSWRLVPHLVERVEGTFVEREGEGAERRRGTPTGDQAGDYGDNLIGAQAEVAKSSNVGRNGRDRNLIADQVGVPRESLIGDQAEAEKPNNVGRSGRGRNLIADQVGMPRESLIGDRAGERGTNSVGVRASAQQGHSQMELTDTQLRILRLCESPQSMRDLMKTIGLSHRVNFSRLHIAPLLEAGLLKLRYPESPRHSRQAYVISEVALPLLGPRAKGEVG